MNKKMTMSRRFALRGAGGVTLGLPWLSSLASAQATPPKRLAVLWQNNGVNETGFWPKQPFGALTDEHFGGQVGIAPLKAHKSRLHLVRGMHLTPTDGHTGQMSLTGFPAKPYSSLDEMQQAWAQGPSLDQVLAPKINPNQRSPLLLRASEGYNGTIFNTLSYRGANQPATHEKNPFLAYRDLVGLGPSGDQKAAALLVQRRKSVLDLVSGRLDLLRSRKLGADDKTKLDLHFSAVRDLEKSLDVQGMMQCGLPAARAQEIEGFPSKDLNLDAKFAIICRMQLDIIALAFACDSNRLGLMMFGAEAGGPVYSFDGLSHKYAQHPISHATQGEATDSGPVENFRDLLTDIDQWHGAQMKYFMDKLAAYSEGAGTVLDNSLVVWMNSMTSGRGHSSTDTPVILGGSLGGFFKTGLYTNVKDAAGSEKPINMFLTTVMNGFGQNETHFGSKAHGRAGQLTQILA